MALSLPKALRGASSRFFKLQYSQTYTSFVVRRVLIDDQHPLHLMYKHLESERKQDRLWWQVTIGTTSSKASVVRTWSRRRLHRAFLEELKDRCMAEDGTILKVTEKLQGYRTIQQLLVTGAHVGLTGSIRIHAMAPLVTAKYADVRKDTGRVIDMLLSQRNEELKTELEHTVVPTPVYRPRLRKYRPTQHLAPRRDRPISARK